MFFKFKVVMQAANNRLDTTEKSHKWVRRQTQEILAALTEKTMKSYDVRNWLDIQKSSKKIKFTYNRNFRKTIFKNRNQNLIKSTILKFKEGLNALM